MLAGLWGEGKAPIPLEFVPLTAGQAAGEFTIDCFRVRHRDTDSFGFNFESRARRRLRPDRLEGPRSAGRSSTQGVGGRKAGDALGR